MVIPPTKSRSSPDGSQDAIALLRSIEKTQGLKQGHDEINEMTWSTRPWPVLQFLKHGTRTPRHGTSH